METKVNWWVLFFTALYIAGVDETIVHLGQKMCEIGETLKCTTE